MEVLQFAIALAFFSYAAAWLIVDIAVAALTALLRCVAWLLCRKAKRSSHRRVVVGAADVLDA